MRRVCIPDLTAPKLRNAGSARTGCCISSRVVLALIPKARHNSQTEETAISKEASLDSVASSSKENVKVQIIVVSGGQTSLDRFNPLRSWSASGENICGWEASSIRGPPSPYLPSARCPAEHMGPDPLRFCCRRIEPASRGPTRPASRAASDVGPRPRPLSAADWSSRSDTPPGRSGPAPHQTGRIHHQPRHAHDSAARPHLTDAGRGEDQPRLASAPPQAPARTFSPGGLRPALRSAGRASDAHRFRRMVNPLVTRHPIFEGQNGGSGGGRGGKLAPLGDRRPAGEGSHSGGLAAAT